MSLEKKSALTLIDSTYLEDGDYVKRKYASLGWKLISSEYSRQYKGVVVAFERDTEMKNYNELVKLQKTIEDIERNIQAKNFLVTSKRKIKSLGFIGMFLSLFLSTLGIMFGLLFIWAGSMSDDAAALIQLGVILLLGGIFIAGTRMFFQSKKKAKINEQLNQIDEIMSTAKKYL